MHMSAKAYAIDRGYAIDAIRRLCRKGKIPYILEGRVYKVNTEAADQYFKAAEVKTQEEKIPKISKFGSNKPYLELLKESQARSMARRRAERMSALC